MCGRKCNKFLLQLKIYEEKMWNEANVSIFAVHNGPLFLLLCCRCGYRPLFTYPLPSVWIERAPRVGPSSKSCTTWRRFLCETECLACRTLCVCVLYVLCSLDSFIYSFFFFFYFRNYLIEILLFWFSFIFCTCNSATAAANVCVCVWMARFL